MSRPIAFALVCVLLLSALVAGVQGPSSVQATCGSVSTPLAQRGVAAAQSAGGAVRKLADDDVTRDQVTSAIKGMGRTLKLWWWAFGGSVRGEEPKPEVAALTTAATTAQAQALSAAGCAQASTCTAPTSSAAVTGTGRAMVEAAAAQFWTGQDLAVAVAIAGAESSFNPDPPNPPTVGGGTMRGLWQINDGAHPQLVNSPGRDWRNPADNAWMAHEVWLAAGRSWSPWSTYTSGGYKRFLSGVSTAAMQNTQPVPPVAPPSSGCSSPNAVIASWNAAHWNSSGNIVGGIRDLIGQAGVITLQELGDGTRNRVKASLPAGWEISDGSQATAIIWDSTRFARVTGGRKVVLEPTRAEIGADGYTIPQKTLTWETLTDLSSGVQFTAASFHLPPSLGIGGRVDVTKPRRLAAYREMQGNVITEVAGLPQPVMAGCDCNLGFDLDSRFQQAGWTSTGDLDTHGSATLDYVWSVGATHTTARVVPDTHGSDHNPVLATYVATGQAPASTTYVPGGPGTGVITSDAPMGQSAIRAAALLGPMFGIKTIGSYKGHQPTQSLATDIMTSDKAQGDALAAYARAHARELNIQYVIWYRQIWNIERDAEGWRPYFDGQSSDANRAHTNHVHVSYYADGKLSAVSAKVER